jgi:transposase
VSRILSVMRSKGTPDELEHRRRLAVQRIFEGYSTQEVADFLGVDPSTVRRWVASFRDRGEPGLVAQPVPGRPRKLTCSQEKIIRRWLDESPTKHGFENELWTAPRLGRLIWEEFAVQLHPKYLSAWLQARGFSPQKPQRVPRERDPKAIAAWLESDWPRIKKKRGDSTPILP